MSYHVDKVKFTDAQTERRTDGRMGTGKDKSLSAWKAEGLLSLLVSVRPLVRKGKGY